MKNVFKMKGPVVVMSIAAIIALAAIVFAFFYKTGAKLSTTETVSKMNLTEEVSATGQVDAAQDLQLAFNSAGEIAEVNAQVGDQVSAGETIAALDSSELNASLLAAQADLAKAQIGLADVQSATSSTSFGEQTMQQSSVSSAQATLVSTLQDNYVKVSAAFGQYTEEFTNNNKNNPAFGVTVYNNGSAYYIQGNIQQSSNLTDEISNVSNLINAWNVRNNSLQTDADIYQASDSAVNAINAFNTLLSDTYTVVNSYTINNTQDQTVYGTYEGYISSYQGVAGQALSAIQATKTAYQSGIASASPNSVALQQTSVESANANVMGIQAQIDNGIITAPIDGTITLQNAKVGEAASAGVPLVSMISNGKFQIDVYVSEADIGKVKVGDSATVTLDAYGDAVPFQATVITVDPAETMVNGVGNYKVTLEFNNEDSRIKTGMTAEVDIFTATRTNVLAVPSNSIIKNGDNDFVLVPGGKGNPIQKQVTVGITGSNDYVEILSGLNEGDKIITFSK